MSNSLSTLLWSASIAGYRLVCTLSCDDGGATVRVVENGHELERHPLGETNGSRAAEEMASALGDRYASRVITRARRHWRMRGEGCLTAHGLRFPASAEQADGAQP